jgi:predicted nucleotidyltransferase
MTWIKRNPGLIESQCETAWQRRKRLDRRQRLDAGLTPDERAGLDAFVDRLRQRYGDDLLRVRLFGSKARGDFHEESDFDLLVVVRMKDGTYRQHWREIVDISAEIELEYGYVTSLVIKNESDYARMCQHQLLLARNIEQDGIDLWMKPPGELTFVSA